LIASPAVPADQWQPRFQRGQVGLRPHGRQRRRPDARVHGETDLQRLGVGAERPLHPAIALAVPGG